MTRVQMRGKEEPGNPEFKPNLELQLIGNLPGRQLELNHDGSRTEFWPVCRF